MPPKGWSQAPVLPTSGCRANPIAREGHEGHQPLDVGEQLQLWVPPPAAGGDSQEPPQFPSTQGPSKPSKTPYGQGASHSQPALCARPHTSLPHLVALAQPLAPFLITKHPSPPLLLEAVQGEGGAARGAPGLGPPGPRTPSQKHRMVEVRRDLWRPSSPTPILSFIFNTH